jgi:hypothetical protein
MRTLPSQESLLLAPTAFNDSPFSKPAALLTVNNEWKSKLSVWLNESSKHHSDASNDLNKFSIMLNDVLEVVSPAKSPTRHLTFEISKTVDIHQASVLTSQGYQIGKLIGEGSFSKVKMAKHILTNGQV